ncbi:uncharacterized protein BKCO1_300046 [Diplodia corticola]|uniref:Guanine nucleotide-exchange factor SEC12 n=1 Tax=Diplodia corticola TaxID=236234 RepID=A0A1J9SEZ4_9PEZI|nr:uncharacterized protein BKCO1_300046 [Diplodia corticola]OJD38983.1 hypothetical protein BKCO1_300046 [Diplodia corticola]
MAPVSFTKATLPYPVYSADFDPYNRGYLVVGGGGGEGRSGVPNQITLLDVSSRSAIDVAGEIDLPRDEDAVMSLANLASKDGLITFAGVNSSEKDRLADKNKHLRSFKIEYPQKKKAAQEGAAADAKAEKGSVGFLGKTSLFTPPTTTAAKKETYQRLLRLSPARLRESGSRRIGAIATDFNPVSELVIFDATTAVPSDWDVIQRINPEEGKDINDIDINESSEGNFSVAFCTNHQVFVSRMTYDFEKKKATSITPADSLRPAYTLPFPDVFKAGSSRPTIKYVRYLTPHHILLCCNHAQRKGAELLILRKLPDAPGEVILQKRLPSRIKAAGGMDVCALNADPVTGAQQIVVAVAGHDISIELYTLEYSGKTTDTLSRFSSYNTLRDVHPLQMTKLTFCPYHSPWHSSSPDGPPKTPGPQYLRLASTSLGNTVVVDTFTLAPLRPRQPRSRYVLKGGAAGGPLVHALSVLVLGFCLLVTLLCLQQYLDFTAAQTGQDPFVLIRVPDAVRQYLDAARGGQAFLPPGARQFFQSASDSVSDAASGAASDMGSKASDMGSRASVIVEQTAANAYRQAADAADEVVRKATTLHLRTLLEAYAPAYLKSLYDDSDNNDDSDGDDGSNKAILVRATGPTEVGEPQPGEDDGDDGSERLSAEVHGSRAAARRADAHARRWQELGEEQKAAWRRRLVRSGAWAVDEGERVLRGVLFSEYAGFVGRVTAEALNE